MVPERSHPPGVDGIALRNRLVPRLPPLPKPGAYRGRDIGNNIGKSGAEKRAHSVFETPRELSGNTMENPPIRPGRSGVRSSTPLRGVTADTIVPPVTTPPPLSTVGDSYLPRTSPVGTGGGLGTHAAEERFLKMSERFQGVIAESMREMASAFVRQASALNESLVVNGLKKGVSRPRQFDGRNVREWLALVDRYYDYVGLDEEARLLDIPNLLEGRALTYWFSTQEHSPELIPQTWDGFRAFLTNRFSPYTVGTTIARLKALKYTGDFEELAEKFAEILSEGEYPSQEYTRSLFVSRFPHDMVRDVLNMDLATWVEVRDHMRQSRGFRQERALEWYELAPPEYRKEVENNPHLVREGWLPKHVSTGARRQEPDRRREDRPWHPNKGRNIAALGGQAVPGRCFECSGLGHRARDCPNRRPETKKNGQRCHRCQGMGHWAGACPTLGKVIGKPEVGYTKVEGRNGTRQGNEKA